MLAFIHIKKTAGKSVKHMLRRELGIAHCDVKRWHRRNGAYSATDLQRLLKIYPWLRSIAGHSVRAYSDLREAFPGLRYYTFVREPIQRCISEYQYCVRMGRTAPGSFQSWIEDPAYRNVQVKSLAGAADLPMALELVERRIAFVGLMERFDESLDFLSTTLNVPRLRPIRGRVNAAPDNSSRDRIRADPDMMQALARANELDTQLYAHIRDVIYPRQRAAVAGRVEPRPQQPQRRYNAGFLANGAYRQLVYKPAVWAYRLTAAGG